MLNVSVTNVTVYEICFSDVLFRSFVGILICYMYFESVSKYLLFDILLDMLLEKIKKNC